MALFHSLLWLSGNILCVCVCVFSIRSPINGHLGCLHVLAIINNAAMNIGLHVTFGIRVFSTYMPSNGIAVIIWTEESGGLQSMGS